MVPILASGGKGKDDKRSQSPGPLPKPTFQQVHGEALLADRCFRLKSACC